MSTRTLASSSTGGTRCSGVRLRVIEGPDRDREFELSSDGTIGTAPNNAVCLKDDTVSRFHCELRFEGGAIRLCDLQSRNGTMIERTRVRDAYLRDGDTVVVGATWLRVEVGRPADVTTSGPTRFGGLVGQAPVMRAAFAALERAAASDATVLLEGETGTGKEEAAAALHQLGRRADGPFVVVDCGAMPRELLLSELFGHERGAFTGASSARTGAFAAAHGGTIFLDELGELPLDLQPQLLRALERKEIRPLGGVHYRAVDVRVVAATNRDLRAEVNDERFRADLYYRLAVVSVRLPALRERVTDLPQLARTLLAGLGAEPAVIERLCSDTLMSALATNPWPGNVRELRNYLERCLVLDSVVATPPPSTAPAPSTELPYAVARRAAIDRFEHDYVRALLERHGGKVVAAAAAARLGRVQMWRLVKKHGGD